MPSGAKRRKALKRKKEKEQNLQQSHQQVGEGNEGPDFKTHDEEKGSDSGDSSTPTAEASEENFSKTHEELMGGSQSGSGDKVVVVVEDLKINADGSERRGIDIEFVGSVKSSSSDNSNSSDEEESYQMDEKKTNGSRVLEVEGEDKKVEETPNFEPIEKILEKQDEKNEVTQVLGRQPESSSGAPIVIDLVMKLKEEGSKEEKLSHVDDSSVEVGNGGNHAGEFELDKSAKESDGLIISSDNQQQQIVTAPPTVQPTSWRSCCGLFDILMGSNR